MEANNKDYAGEITTSAYDDEGLDFGLTELMQAAYGA